MESSDRWGRGRYLVPWALLSGAQALTMQSIATLMRDDAPGGQLAAYGLGILLLQAMKLVPTFGRLRDLGRPPDDALWTFVPLMNVALWTWLLAATPSDARRAARMQVWEGSLQALPAWGYGARRMASVPGPVVVGSVLLIGGELALTEGVAWLTALDAEARASWAEGLQLAAMALGFYLVWAVLRRRHVRPSAWTPGWLAIPALAGAMGLTIEQYVGDASTAGQLSLAGMQLALAGSVGAVAYGLALAVVLPALERSAGREVPSATTGAVVAAAVGRTNVVLVGMQVILPGVWFAVSWAMAEVAAVRRPAARPFPLSAVASANRRGAILKVLLVWGLASTAASVVAIPVAGFGAWQAALLGVQPLPALAALLEGVVVAPITLACVAALREIADEAGLGDGAAGGAGDDPA